MNLEHRAYLKNSYAANWTYNAYHGTVIWSWPMAMMAAGLERQLDRCNTTSLPQFCSDLGVYAKVRLAYNHLWDLIEANTQQLSTEVWSWLYQNGTFQEVDFGTLPPPPGTSPTGGYPWLLKREEANV
jgi:hypothetical protein